jgi:hypothetical protein
MSAEKHIWRALRPHVQKNHTLRVHLVHEFDTDLQIDCVWCGRSLAAGSPQLVNSIGDQLVQSGAKVVRPKSQPQVRLQ